MAELLRCKRCRLTLISNEEFACVTSCHGSTKISEDEPCLLDRSVIYIKEEEMPSWIGTLVETANWTKGKIICPSVSCAARLGSFDFFSGQKCECQQFVLPPIRLVASKVDKLKLDAKQPAVH